MYGSGQHALHLAGLDQAAGSGGRQQNAPYHDSALAPGQIPFPELCPSSECHVSLCPHANSEGTGDLLPSPSADIAIPGEISDLPLEALDLSIRLFNLFRHAGVFTVGQVLEMNLEALSEVKLGEKSILELIDRVQALHLLDPARQGLREERSETAPTGRHDNRRRPGRGKLRARAPHQPQPQELRISSNSLLGFCYKVQVRQLPYALRLELPRWARCGIEQDEDNKTERSELPRRTRYCYVQPFTLEEAGELTAWLPDPTGNAPSHYRVAATSDALRRAAFIEVDPQEAQALLRELLNAAAPSPLIRVAPAFFLTREMRAMIAPGVAFPDAFVVPENASRRRVSLKRGNQVPIPRRVAGMRIESLSLSEKTHSCLRQAGVTTLGALLELEEERLGAILDRESLWELSTAAFAKGALPTPGGLLPVEHSEERSEPVPICETFYYYPTGTTYDDPELGRLYLVRAALFVDRLDGSRSGPVETLWLTRAQIGQSLLWHRDLAQLDSLELRTRVTRHAVARGAMLPHMSRAEDRREEGLRQMLEMEEQYNLVPLRSEYKGDTPLELFISEADMKAADEKHLSPTSTVIGVLEHYLEHPQAQPVGHRLSVDTLDAIHYWLKEDRKQLRQLNAAWERRFPGQPCPAGSSIVRHEEYAIHTYKEWNEETGRTEVKQTAEPVYRLIIGVLLRTRVPSDLIVEPRHTKPVFPTPERPIRPCRTPNYVPIQQAA